MYELTPTPEQRALAESLKLPPTFFCYKNKPDYLSEDDDGKEYLLKIIYLLQDPRIRKDKALTNLTRFHLFLFFSVSMCSSKESYLKIWDENDNSCPILHLPLLKEVKDKF